MADAAEQEIAQQEEVLNQEEAADGAEPAAKKQRVEEAADAADAEHQGEPKGDHEGEPKGEKPEEPAAKKQRAEEPGAGEAADTEGTAAAAPAAEAKAVAPLKIGYRTFQSGSDCYKYFHNIMTKWRKNQNLNEYEFHMVEDLIRKGHPDAQRKLGSGLAAVQVRDVSFDGNTTTCFYLIHNDSKGEDVSYRKCLANLFPDLSDITAHYGQKQQHKSPGGGRGRGGGRGGGGRGGGGSRGGRGRGRGRR